MTVAMRYETRNLLDHVLNVLAEYDHPLTLRQLYYRLVAAQVLENVENHCRRLGRTLVKAREARLVTFGPP